MKSSSHGRFTSAIPIALLFTLSFSLIITLAVPAAITFTTPEESVAEIFLRPNSDRVIPLSPERSSHRSIAPAISDPVPRSLPYVEDFTSLPHLSSTYPAGWAGAQVGAGTSAGSAGAFKTIEPTNDLGLNANSSASSTAGAVHNFNGKIGFLSTGSADPSVVLAIDTSGLADVYIAFDVMTVRNPYNGTTNTRISEVDLQYRICSSLPCSGVFASASASPGIYRNNTASQTSGTAPQNPEAKLITLPSTADGQPYVQLRWVQRDISGMGARPSFAIDNVSITGEAPCTSPVVTTDPGDQGVTYGVSIVTFTSTASGDPIPSIQWEVDTGEGFVSLPNGGAVSGADTATLTISPPEVAMSGKAYRAVFTNGCEAMPSATSNVATLSVAPLAITVTPDADQTKVYGETDPMLSYVYAPPLAFSDTFSGELSRAQGQTAGSYDVTQGTLALSSNYNLVFTSDVAFTITPKELVAGIIVDGKVYDGSDAAEFTCSLSGVISPDLVDCSGGIVVFPSSNVGSYSVNASGLALTGPDSANYSLPITTATDSAEIIVRPITVTAVAASKTYDGNLTSSAVPTVTIGSIVGSDTAIFTQAFLNRDAGPAKTLVASGFVNDGNAGNNYAITFIDNTAGIITQKPVTVTAVATTKLSDGNTSSSGMPTIAPALVGGDTPNFIQTYDTPFAGAGKTLTPSGTANDGNAGLNYSYTIVPVHNGVIIAANCFAGFHSPIGGSVESGTGGSFSDPVRSFKLGSTIPIKFTLYAAACGGTPIITGVHTLQLIKYANAVDSDPAIDATPTDAATTGNQFRLAGTEWHFNLDTKRTPGIIAGTWLVTARLQDGSVKTVWISIKK